MASNRNDLDDRFHGPPPLPQPPGLYGPGFPRQSRYPQPPMYDHPGSRPIYYPPPPHLNTTSSSDSSPFGRQRGGPIPPPPPLPLPLPQHHHPPFSQSFGGPNRVDNHSSSFESHGSSHGSVPPFIGSSGGGTYVPYPADPHFPPPYPPHPSHHLHPHAMLGPPHPGYPAGPYYAWPAPIEYVSDVKPLDVLSGRGGATNCHSGNRAFRQLIKEYQDEYFRAKKKDKPSIAANVVRVIREKGGRFLRKCDVGSPTGEILYYDIGDSRANEKACQALREGAPNLKGKRRKGSSSSEDDEKYTSSESSPKVRKEDMLSSPASSSGRCTTRGKESEDRAQRDDESDDRDPKPSNPRDKAIFITPSAKLLRRSRVKPIPLEALSAQEQECYLKDFLPPSPTFSESEDNFHVTIEAQDYDPQDENSGPWPPVVRV